MEWQGGQRHGVDGGGSEAAPRIRQLGVAKASPPAPCPRFYAAAQLRLLCLLSAPERPRGDFSLADTEKRRRKMGSTNGGRIMLRGAAGGDGATGRSAVTHGQEQQRGGASYTAMERCQGLTPPPAIGSMA